MITNDIKQRGTVKIKSILNNEMTFDLYDLPIKYANYLRRILCSEIPTLAFDQVEIVDNCSLVLNETIIQRIELIPIVGLVDCPSGCNHDFLLEARSGDHVYSVTSSDIVNNTHCIKILGSIIITKLLPEQYIRLNITVKKGLGIDHAKWSSVENVRYSINDNIYRFTVEMFEHTDPRRLLQSGIMILQQNHNINVSILW